MRPVRTSVLVTVLLAACSGGGAPSTPSGPGTGDSSPPSAPASISQAGTEGPDGSPTPDIRPMTVPGVPPTFPLDVEPADLTLGELVPDGAEVTATAFPGEDVAIVTWAIGDDPFRREQGLVVWRRTPGEQPPWIATYAFRDPPRAGVLGIQLDTADATGDGEPDALVFENVGGSGTCGTWRLISLAAGSDTQTYGRDLCDATLEISSRPVGLRLIESVFAPGDPHCCPTGTATTMLVWNGARWRVDPVERAEDA